MQGRLTSSPALHFPDAFICPFAQILLKMMIANTSQIRKADAMMISEYAFPSLLLMETAGRKAAEWLLQHRPETYIYYVLIGPGNNGGDGLVIARYLHAAGKTVQMLLSADPAQFKGDALLQWHALQGAGVYHRIWPCSLEGTLQGRPQDYLLIDTLLGTGVQAELRGSVAEIIAEFARFKIPTIAIDMPSGLNADTGECRNEVLPAQATLTFQCPKVCHVVHPAAASCGEIVTLDIGIWPSVMLKLGIQRFLLDADMCRHLYQQRPADGHKGTFGHALSVGGSKAFAGAIALTGMAALQAGAGLSTVFTTETARCAVYAGHAELMVATADLPDAAWLEADALPALLAKLSSKNALALGPGLGNEAPTCDFVKGLLQAWGRPLVIDADGLNVLSSEPELWRYVPQYSILTPHPGEMARLMPWHDVKLQRIETAEHLAAEKQVIVILKGAGTIVALPSGKTYVNTTGNDGMATGGAGDVLTGMLVGLLAQGYTPEVAARLGVYLHGRAGDLCRDLLGAAEAVTASGIAGQIGRAIAELRG
jgi:ADP-dependent NAD(P)H-hydrate dehydratase / NAD(P)H-hydrate epimerase